MLPNVKIITDPDRPTWAEVYIDDVLVPGLRSYQLDMSVDAAPVITLNIIGKIETITYEKQKSL